MYSDFVFNFIYTLHMFFFPRWLFVGTVNSFLLSIRFLRIRNIKDWFNCQTYCRQSIAVNKKSFHLVLSDSLCHLYLIVLDSAPFKHISWSSSTIEVCSIVMELLQLSKHQYRNRLKITRLSCNGSSALSLFMYVLNVNVSWHAL